MSPQEFLSTAILLGVFVACAGCYGLLYTLARLRLSHVLMSMAYGAYLLQGVATVILLTQTSLAVVWKLLLVASFLIYAGIPPVTWRHLERTHQPVGHQS
ncbi:MAG: hypothetical protein R3F24_11345 [Gammaproteobacteria bacterium]